jgi:hypothetical protein
MTVEGKRLLETVLLHRLEADRIGERETLIRPTASPRQQRAGFVVFQVTSAALSWH